jgi:alpha-1,2-mannosyltransferase
MDQIREQTSGRAGLPAFPWAYLALLTVPLAIAGLVVWYATHGVILFGDIDWYRTALPGLLSDQPLYDPEKLQPHVLERPPFWNQPPSTALFTLVLLVPEGGWIWGLIMVVGVVMGLVVMWPRVGPGGTVLLAPVLLLWPPVPAALAWANVNGLVFGLLALAWRFPRLAGLTIGLAAALKLLPILAVAWLLGKRDWRNAALAVVLPVVATLIVVAWDGFSTLSDFVVLQLNERAPQGTLVWSFTRALGLPAWAGFAAALLLTAAAWRFASLSLSILAMLVSLAWIHPHYLTWILLPLLGAWLPWLISALNPGSRRAINRGETMAEA